jgi:hypothetical protein
MRPGGCSRRTIRLRMKPVRRRQPLPHQRPRRRQPRLLPSGLLARRHSLRQIARSGSFSASAGASLAQTEAAERPTARWAGTMPTTASLSATLRRRALQTGPASHVRPIHRRVQLGKRGGHVLMTTLLGLACRATMLRGVLSTSSLPQMLQSEAPPPSKSVLSALPCSSAPSPSMLPNFFLLISDATGGAPSSLGFMFLNFFLLISDATGSALSGIQSSTDSAAFAESEHVASEAIGLVALPMVQVVAVFLAPGSQSSLPTLRLDPPMTKTTVSGFATRRMRR